MPLHFTFRKKEILRRKSLISLLISSRSKCKAGFLLFHYHFVDHLPEDTAVQVAFSVPKKLHRRASRRNLIRRRMKEAYRLNRKFLLDNFKQEGLFCLLMIVHTGREQSSYGEINDSMLTGLTAVVKSKDK